MITARGLGKRFGDVQAVRDLSFDVRPGVVTGFLGPNGAGKSTTMRLMLDLDRGQGETRFDGRRYRELVRPLHTVGAVLEARSFHPTRRARDHLRMLAAATGLPAARVLLLVLWAVVGAALALLMRATTGPIVVLLVVPLLVEPLLGLLLSTERLAALNPLARFLPFQAGRGMALPGEALVGSQPEALTRVQAVGVFCTFTAVLVALGWAVFERRDA